MKFRFVKALSLFVPCILTAPVMANLSLSLNNIHAVIESDELPVRPLEADKSKQQPKNTDELPKNDDDPLNTPSDFEPPQLLLAQNYFDPGTHADDIKPVEPQPDPQQMPPGMSSQQAMPSQNMPPQQNQWFDPSMNTGQQYPGQGQYQDPEYQQLQQQRAEQHQRAMEKLQEFAQDGFSSNHQSSQYTSRPAPKFGYYQQNRERRELHHQNDQQMMTDDERKAYMYERMRSIYPGRSN